MNAPEVRHYRLRSWLRSLVATLLLVAPSVAHAQVYVYITPYYGEYAPGTQVAVTIEYCAYSEQFDGPGYVLFNGQDVSTNFPFTSGSPPTPTCFGTTDQGWAQGTVTIVAGQNTLTSGISTWTQFGQETATYTGSSSYGVSVTPDGSVVPNRAFNTGGYSESFTVANIGGVSDTYTITCSGMFNVTCTGTSQTSVTLAGGGSTSVVANYSVGGTGTGRLKLSVSGTSGQAADTGYWTVPVVIPTYQVGVTPDGASQWASIPSAGAQSATFTIENRGNIGTLTYSLSVVGCTTPLSGCNIWGSPSVTLAQGESQSRTVQFNVQNTLGVGTITLRATHTASGTLDDGSVLVATTNTPLDDSLPAVPLAAVYHLLPGALPLPPDSLKGCPVLADNPEIHLAKPFSYVTQPFISGSGTPEGNIFMAQVVWDTTFDVTAVWRDYGAADQKTCAGSAFLTEGQYAWSYWLHGAPADPLWSVYPYGDRTGASSAGVGTKDPQAVPMPQHSTAGAIDGNSYRVWLNGTLIINNGQPVAGVTLMTSSATGATYRVSTSLANRHNVTAPTANNGGWNELKASIADLSGRRTTIRARFVVVRPDVITPLTLTALRDFTHLAQNDCAAFGAFQCGGVTLTQVIPGFITRDRDRSLHLVYRSASQREPTLLPQRLFVDRLQMAPDSIHVTALDANLVAIGRTMRYMGTRVPGGSPVVASTDTLRQHASEDRVVGAEVASPASGNAAIRIVNVRVRAFYAESLHDAVVPQEVVQLHLSDTLATRFGLGWQLAQVSRLSFGLTFQGAPAAIWRSGDGSYSIFRQVGGTWVTPPRETAKLLDSLTTAGLFARYVISLSSGARLGFDATGLQTATADLVGNRTRFWYGVAGRLDSIVDPANIGYRFVHNGTGQASEVWVRHANGTLTKVAALIYGGPTGQWLTQLKIWRQADELGNVSDSTKFAYATATPYGAYLDTIYDPRHKPGIPIITTLVYDSLFATATKVRRPPDNQGVSAEAKLWDPWRRALPRLGRGVAPSAPAERTVFASQLLGTFTGFAHPPVDFTVDRFGGPTYVRRLAASGSTTGDDVRRVARDSLGRVLRIIHAPDSSAIADSVVYRYDAFNRLDRIIRNTLAHPATPHSLDTTTFTYDSVSLAGGVRCHRLRSMKDAMGGITRANYDSAGAGVRPCLVIRAIGLAPGDTTRFSYGPLTLGHPATARPVQAIDPNGLTESMTYDPATWNSAVHVRQGDNATTSVVFDAFGRPDHVIDPVGTRTDYRYDLSGRVLRTKTGQTSTTAPTTRTFYNGANLVDSVRVYSSPGGVDGGPAGTIQVTEYYYDRLGRVDSTVTPGGRVIGVPLRDGFGNPVTEHPGNSTIVSRLFDWQGRLISESPSQVDPNQPLVPNQSFATSQAFTAYQSLGLSIETGTLSPGQVHGGKYDTKGRVVWTSSREANETDSIVVHRLGYSRANALIADTVTFRGGGRVIRTFEYNRRGQRTLARDTIMLVAGGSLAGDRGGAERYHYNNTTARLDSTVATSAANKVARVRWFFDRGGRDSVRVVRLGSGSGYASDSLRTRFVYDAAGRVTTIVDSSNTGVWHRFTSPVYNKADHLKSGQVRLPSASGGPANALDHTLTYAYDSVGGTWRLLSGATSGTGSLSNTYTYDVFGNRLTNFRQHGFAGCAANGTDTSWFGPDNELVRTHDIGCSRFKRFWNDGAGNRLLQRDTNAANPTVDLGPQTIESYTAKQHLFFAMSWTIQAGTYDYQWHWYDGAGRRVITRRKTGSTWVPQQPPTGGTWTHYVYDGPEVALTLRQSGTTWSTGARYLSAGPDGAVAGRFEAPGGPVNLALIADRQGTTLAAMRVNGTQEDNAKYFSRDPYGGLPGASGSEGSINTETGYTGASTPSQIGGFAYLRNRWYDPQTGRFLTQDPIGLAGGVNLYAYAGNNPVTFTDPFGLCPPETPWTPDCDKGLESAGLLDPTMWIAGGLAAGLRAGLVRLLARGAGTAAADAAATQASSAAWSGGRTALRSMLKTGEGWIEGMSGRQGLRLLEKLDKGAVDDISIVMREGGDMVASFARNNADKTRTVVERVINAAGEETSIISRTFSEAGKLLNSTVYK